MAQIDEGDKVRWDWGNGTAEGRVREVYTGKITRKINGSEITRNGTPDCPAYLVEQQDGTRVLKLHSELRAA